MPNLLNGLVNGWVKVNSKHVIFPKEEHRRERRDSNASSLDEEAERILDRSRGKSHHEHSPQTTSTVSTMHSDPEAQAIRKFNSKRQNNKRRLQRTRSHSDLLREMADKGKPKSTSQRVIVAREANSVSHAASSRADTEPVQLVAGFFGSNVGGGGGGENNNENIQRQQNGRPVTTGKYLNEQMFVQQLSERSKAGSTRHSVASSASSAASDRTPQKSSRRPAHAFQDSDSHDYSYRNADSRSHGSTKSDRVQSPKKHECAACSDMENQLLAAYDDIRHLRDVSLRNECATPPKSNSSILANHELTTVADASKRLSEVTGRHRRQIEQMTRETSRKQHGIHFKHSKMSMICKTLNDESSIRKQEAMALEEEVRDLKTERDKLATEVQRLRTEVSLHKQEQQEHELLRERMTSYEKHSLEQADKAIRERDQVIGDLSTRLERTLETLEIEREQQRQRRQIIFPGAKSEDASTSSADVAALQEELRKAKEAARASEALLETTRAEAAKREMALTIRCDELKSEKSKTN